MHVKISWSVRLPAATTSLSFPGEDPVVHQLWSILLAAAELTLVCHVVPLKVKATGYTN